MPRLPIPALEDTLRRYAETARAISGSEAETAAHLQLVEQFASSNGPLLDAKLRAMDAQNAQFGRYPHSFIEEIWDAMYLEARCPNPVNINPSYLLNLPELDSNGDRNLNLARFTLGALAWHQKVKDGKLDGADAGAVCFSPFGKQLGAARVPALHRDVVEFHPDSRHIVVFCGSNVFSVDVIDENGHAVSAESLRDTFVHIQNRSFTGDSNSTPLAVLTAADRDDWAKARKHLAKDPHNAASLAKIDSALVSIAIDGPHGTSEAGGTATATDLSTASLLGNTAGGSRAQPRWFDKHQLLLLENGDLGYNFEHSYSDGMSWNRMLSEVAAHVQGLAPPRGCTPLEPLPTQTSGRAASANDVTFQIDTASGEVVEAARQSHDAVIANVDNKVVDFTEFGKDEIKSWKHAPDAVVQVALIAGYTMLDAANGHGGRLPTVYEACSMAKFFHGRTETIRSLNPATAAFVKALQVRFVLLAGRKKGDHIVCCAVGQATMPWRLQIVL